MKKAVAILQIVAGAVLAAAGILALVEACTSKCRHVLKF